MRQPGLKDLKHYLGTGLKCHAMGENNDDEKVIPKLLTLSGIHGEWAYVSGIRKTVDEPVIIEDLFPILLPLSALTEPLPDGRIPIVELAKMAEMLEPISFDKMEDHVRLQRGVTAKDRFNNQWLMFDFKHGFSMWHKPHHEFDHRPTLCDSQLALFEYLYANHFWLGDQSLFETGEIIDKRTLKQTP